MDSGDVARRYHRETAHGRGPRRRPHSVPGFVPMDPANQPGPFKRYPSLAPQPLPERLPVSEVGAADVLSGRTASDAAPVDAGVLARLLFSSSGVTRVMGRPGARTYFRAAPSAGNLHPLETYVVSGPIDGLEGGVYHFAPDAFGLEQLRRGEYRPHLADVAAAPAVANAPATLVVTGIPWRTAWKYAERGWRHLYWDAGTMLANLLAVADAHGVDTQVLLGFRDAAVRELIGIDGVAELPLAVVRLGMSTAPTPRAEVPSELPELRQEATPTAAPIELPLVTEVQRAGDLGDAAEVRRWREARTEELTATAGPRALPASLPMEPIEEVVLRRGSTRRMRRDTVTSDALSWAVAAATRQVPHDPGQPGSTLLTHGLSVHAVDGVEPGLYGWTAGGLHLHKLEPEEEARVRATRLCLDQSLGGDSAYALFANCPLGRVLDAYGDRGYRAAQLEAGIVAGRLQLAAFALGYGGTGFTFYDDEVSATFDTDATCMLVTSIGVPAYRSRRGGEPGHPVELTDIG